MILALADFFDVSVDYLVGRTNDPAFPPSRKNKRSIWFHVLKWYNEEKPAREVGGTFLVLLGFISEGDAPHQ